MKTVVILLATLLYLDNSGTENTYSWQLQFRNFSHCQGFYEKNQAHILNGLLDYAERTYQKPMEINYLACAIVEDDAAKEHPNVISQLPLYQNTPK